CSMVCLLNVPGVRPYPRNGGRYGPTLRRSSKCAPGFGPPCAARSAPPRLGEVDAEGLAESPSSQRGDDDGVAARRPLHPAEIEEAPGQRRPERTREVRAAFGPI